MPVPTNSSVPSLTSPFEFSGNRLVFGVGCSQRLGSLCANHGTRVLVVCGSQPQRLSSCLQSLSDAGISHQLLQVSSEPDLEIIEAGVGLAQAGRIEAVIGIGGGSVLDAAKAIAALSPQPTGLWDHLEVIGQGLPLSLAPLPVIALPTTAGTGSEATRNAVLTSTKHHLKVSLRDPGMLPTLALVDPALSLTCPSAVTASSGMDALTQCLEALLSSRANPLSDSLAARGVTLCMRHLPMVHRDGGNLESRSAMALAAYLSGLALASAGLGVVHALASPLGGLGHQAHGALCAAMLPAGLEINARAILNRGGDTAKMRLQQAVSLLAPGSGGGVEQAVDAVRQLSLQLAIPSLGQLGLPAQDHARAELIAAALRSNSMKSNPVPLESDELRELLERSL